MKTPVVLFLLAISLLCCNDMQEKQSEKEIGYQDVWMENISDFEIIDGCGCFFSLGKEEYFKHDIILAFNYEVQAIIRINDETIVLTSNKIIDTVYPSSEHRIFENDNYLLEVIVSDESQSGDEIMVYTGELKLTIKENGKIFIKDIYGECGC